MMFVVFCVRCWLFINQNIPFALCDLSTSAHHQMRPLLVLAIVVLCTAITVSGYDANDIPPVYDEHDQPGQQGMLRSLSLLHSFVDH
jgi:hypothetical protein